MSAKAIPHQLLDERDRDPGGECGMVYLFVVPRRVELTLDLGPLVSKTVFSFPGELDLQQ